MAVRLPKLPLTRFVDPTLMHEMAQYVVMHVLIAHRGQPVAVRFSAFGLEPLAKKYFRREKLCG